MSKPTIVDIIKSVIAAAIGVQTNANRQRDFQQGSLKAYIIGGIIFTVIFVISLVLLVSAILAEN